MPEHPSQFKPVRTLPRATVGSTRRRRRHPLPPKQVSPPVKQPEQPVEHVETEGEAPEQTYWAWMWVAACGVAAAAYILGLL
ncbi:MAG: hypothetical protein P8J86_00355 [Phycisphaerales bacterium]|nr:hypothetical protein [Phycisphaerales bacterium]